MVDSGTTDGEWQNLVATPRYSAGPWTVDDLGHRHFLGTNHRYGIGAIASPVYRIAKIEGCGDEAVAVARLVAASPALLTGCELALAVFRRLGIESEPEATLIADIVKSAVGD